MPRRVKDAVMSVLDVKDEKLRNTVVTVCDFLETQMVGREPHSRRTILPEDMLLAFGTLFFIGMREHNLCDAIGKAAELAERIVAVIEHTTGERL